MNQMMEAIKQTEPAIRIESSAERLPVAVNHNGDGDLVIDQCAEHSTATVNRNNTDSNAVAHDGAYDYEAAADVSTGNVRTEATTVATQSEAESQCHDVAANNKDTTSPQQLQQQQQIVAINTVWEGEEEANQGVKYVKHITRMNYSGNSRRDIEGDDAVISQQNRDNTLKSERKQDLSETRDELKAYLYAPDRDEAEDELLRSDDDCDGSSNGRLDDISIEKENELLNSDEDNNVYNSEKPPLQPMPDAEGVGNEIINHKTQGVLTKNESDSANDDKEVYMISDDENSDSDREVGNAEHISAVDRVENCEAPRSEHEHMHNDIINLADDDDYGSESGAKTTTEQESAAEGAHQLTGGDKESVAGNGRSTESDSKQHRLLYEFEIEDSSQESGMYKVPRDDVEEEESDDTFASLNDDDDESRAATELPLDTSKSTASPVTMTQHDDDEQEPPKVNGNHKLMLLPSASLSNEETDTLTNPAVKCRSENPGKHNKQTANESNHIRRHDEDDSGADIRAVKEPAVWPLPAETSSEQPSPVVALAGLNDDGGSRCSSQGSWTSGSLGSSSSHQLVIDDLEPEMPQTAAAGSEESTLPTRIAPLKVSLKRKLSDTTNETPPEKRCLEDTRNIETPIVTMDQQLPEQVGRPDSEPTMETNTPIGSLLLKHLQRPYPQPPTSLINDFQLPPPILSQNSEGSVRRFLCFKCKAGSFDTLAALNAHQVNCLSGLSLLPPLSSAPHIMAAAPVLLQTLPAVSQPSALNVSNDAATIMPPVEESTISTPPKLMALQLQTENEKERIYKCTKCSTCHDSLGFFLHTREQHQRYLCLYCCRTFPTAEKLSLHLEIKHDLEQNHFNSEQALRQISPATEDKSGGEAVLFLMCCSCQHVFVDNEPFSDHQCGEFIQPCTLCGQKSRHTNDCPTHSKTKLKKRDKGKVQGAPLFNSVVSQSSYHSLQQPNTNSIFSHCDRSRRKPRDTPTITAVSTLISTAYHHQQNDDSDSSTNMVIDESCSNNTIATPHIRSNDHLDGGGALVPNPFSGELEERERRSQQKPEVIALDRIPSVATERERVPPLRLVVPKFKLRVPKEFQKSVDAALSSTDCDDDDDNEEDDVDENRDEMVPNTCAAAQSLVGGMDSNAEPNMNNAADTGLTGVQENSLQHTTVEKNESFADPQSNLMRILQEIERTKLDIQRTKESFHSKRRHNSAGVPPVSGEAMPPAVSPKHEAITITAAAERDPAGGAANKNWSPTPPASPHSRISQCGDEEQPPPLQPPPLERRDTVGSDVMDIDDTITGGQAHIMAQSENEKIQDSGNAALVVAGSELIHSTESNDPDNATGALKAEEPAVDEVTIMEAEVQQSPPPPGDGIEMAGEDIQIVELQLDRPLERYAIVELVRICLKAIYPLCLYCNHARRIAVNGQSLVLHMIAEHRFSAVVDSITAEELMPATIVAKLKSFLPALELECFNSSSFCTIGAGAYTRPFNERIFECFQCRFVTSTHKELYLHNRKMHLRTAILCFMCRANFFSFSEILCHICPGAPHKTPVFDVKFRCCLCDVTNIPSPFRLMVHLRKRHGACDVCLEDCRDQGRLSSHVWKHKLHHVCYRCGVAYRNKMDITKHLFWKHGTESTICKRCLQKRWPHVYHFCVPPSTFVCDVCTLDFSRAMYLTVHRRIHCCDFRYPCTEEHCDEKFISRPLLLKHVSQHQPPTPLLPPQPILVADAAQTKDSKGEVREAGEMVAVAPGVPKSPLAGESAALKQEVGEIKVEPKDGAAPNNIKREQTDLALPKRTATEFKNDAPAPDDKSAKGPSAERGGAEKSTIGLPERRKKKRKKRPKESLEDLNLTAPNLSESDSSGDSDAESRSKDDDSLVPNVMLSPPSEAENEAEEGAAAAQRTDDGNAINRKVAAPPPVQVLEMWKSLLQAQAGGVGVVEEEGDVDYTDTNWPPAPKALHVAYSDHDYCVMHRPPTPPLSTAMKRKSGVAAAGKTPRRRAGVGGGSSSSSGVESSSESDSSCSCGTNCSCSSSGSGASSSSTSSSDSDSSAGSNVSRKRHRKKSERDRARKKSQSVSPLKKRNATGESPHVNVDDDAPNDTANGEAMLPASPLKEPFFNESDLQTAESETDEEFYDEHPQKLASELLAQKRAQLMAQTRLSPSHNFDIVENSRPSTPSLPEDVAACETKIKQKKKKRDRKSSTKPAVTAPSAAAGGTVSPEMHLSEGKAAASSVRMDGHPVLAAEYAVPSVLAEPLLFAQQAGVPYTPSSLFAPYGAVPSPLTPRPIALHLPGRMSEGSSCSDADGSLKRSKRARRPNKFYGYTSDDDSTTPAHGQPLLIGMRAFKPQPPPQLTWRKEDLPTPSRSILNNNSSTNNNSTGNKVKQPRAPKISGFHDITSGSAPFAASTPIANQPKKRRQNDGKVLSSQGRKRSTAKRAAGTVSHLPPIPRLKIRPSQVAVGGNHIPSRAQLFGGYYDNNGGAADEDEEEDEDDDDEEDESSDSSSDDGQPPMDATQLWRTALQLHTSAAASPLAIAAAAALPQRPAAALLLPPTPQTTAFNHKIPPALLPNPDFATLQYFKANNIRYPIRPPAGARQPRDGESVYCYCRCPYDEVSEMIACDGDNCLIEWFHFECVGIMVAPQGKWFCAECRPQYSEELYPTVNAVAAAVAQPPALLGPSGPT